jgi:hypothetical protein
MAEQQRRQCPADVDLDRELPQRGRTRSPDQGTDQQRLVDVAHPHAATDELDDLFRRLLTRRYGAGQLLRRLTTKPDHNRIRHEPILPTP